MYGCFLCPKQYHFRACRSTGLEVIPKTVAPRMRSAPGCDLQLHHKMFLLNECLHADNSKTMNLNGLNSEAAFFFDLVYIGLTTCGSPGYPEAVLSTSSQMLRWMSLGNNILHRHFHPYAWFTK